VTTSVDPEFERLLEYVRDARGFDYTDYRRPSLMRRFEKRLHAVDAEGWEAYRAHLESNPEEFAALFDTILINVTGFFRDQETWDLVAAEVVPRLLEHKDGNTPIRVWSAGCASGEEPYSVVMLLCEAMGEDRFRGRVKVYATDVDEDALSLAREARYLPKQLETVPGDLRERYFRPANGELAFRKDLRRCVIFGRNDLLRDPPISRVDLLFARNTLMYFDGAAQARVLSNFYFALTRGGYLVAGKAEAFQAGGHLFRPYDLKRRVFVKDGTADLGFRVAAIPEGQREPEPSNLRDVAFEHASIAQLVVDEEDRLVAANQPARAAFGLRSRDVGRPLQDLEISYRPVELRSLVEEVRERRQPTSVKEVRWQPAKGSERIFDVRVEPLGDADRVVGISIAFVDVTQHRELEEHLESARRELESAYEELQSTVEELETTNEELQSTNEELETMNEELQSTNEELETMNEELQSTNEELETMNEELRDRTDETMRAYAFLASVLSGIKQAVVVVDRDFRVVAWNRLAADLWGVREDEVEGQDFFALEIGMPVGPLREQIMRVLEGMEPEELDLEGHDRRGRVARYRIGFAPLNGEPEPSVLGAIVLVNAEGVS